MPPFRLDTFENPSPDKDYSVSLEIPEFTCLCPLSGNPDFAELHIEYSPAAKCIELKSLKNYIASFRNRQAFHEAVANEIVDFLFDAVKPRRIELVAEFKVRGGIYTTVTAARTDAD